MSPALRRALALGIACLLGVLTGHVGGTALAQVWAEAQPEGWRRRVEPTPYMTPTTYGPVPVTGAAFVLGHYEALLGPTPAETVELEVVLPSDGELVVYPRLSKADPIEGVGVVLRPGAAPRSTRSSADRGAEERDCQGEGPPLAANTPLRVHIQAGQGGTIAVETDGGGWSCAGAGRATGPVAIQAGLRRVAIPRLAIDGADVPPPLAPAIRWGIALAAGAALMGLVAVETAAGVGWLAAALGWLPLLLAALLATRDLSSLHDLLRMPALPVRALPLLLGVAAAVLPKGLVHAARLTRRGAPGWAGAALLGATLGGGPALAAGAPAAATLLFALTGALVALLGALQLHARSLRGYNVISLLVATASLFSLEFAIRQTSVGDFWNGEDRSRGAGTATTLSAEFEALAAADPTTYPSEGYPVQAPPKRAPLRIVCLGGSSTGGAFQNDDLADFYPARLAERLGPGIEVINQGTGGWNSLHIALFAEQSLERLRPDIVTVYAGVNDQVESPILYRELHAAWADGHLRPGATGPADSIRLFQGLRFAARGLRGSVIAVPPEHTADNLRRVVAAAEAVGARTLLMSEAVQPRPEAFAPYWRAMQGVAEGHPDAAFLHTAEQLRGLGPKGFLDQNHLSDLGHRKLAERVEGALRGKTWLRSTPRTDPRGSPAADTEAGG